jgi:D-amino peptidase
MEVRVNGVAVGEIGLNAIAAGHFGVPTVLVTGDRAACEEAEGLLGRVETVVTKENISRYQSRAYPPALIREAIREKARTALRDVQQFRPMRPDLPIRCEVDFVHTACTQKALLIPGCEMLGPRCIGRSLETVRELLPFQLLLLGMIQHAKDDMY